MFLQKPIHPRTIGRTAFCFLAMCAALLTACADYSGPPTPPSNSGIEGQVHIGPACPVVTIPSPCPDAPFRATLTIQDDNGKNVAQLATDALGRFRVALPAGTYLIVPETPNPGRPPRGKPHSASVRAGQYTQVIITYDSGIR
jgi:hypothetical protein